VADHSASTLDYAPPEGRIATRRETCLGVVVFLATLCVMGMPTFVDSYVASRHRSMREGMTPAEVDRHLWTFMSRPGYHHSMAPGESAVAYELLGWGEQIKVIVDPNGIVTSVIPSFDD